ncbi:MAG: lyase family protein [Planctomycetota bacterium]
MAGDEYVDPLAERYASAEMVALFSPRQRTLTWRDLWIALADEQRALGVAIRPEQIAELRRARDNIDFARVAEHEKRLRHDVMAHVLHYGEVAPGARAILHLGATSCYVTDNADLILMREGLRLLLDRLRGAIHALGAFARREAGRPTLGLTHLQPAQLTTVGKRAALWLQDLVTVHCSLDELATTLPFRGVKGTTGTQASFLQLFRGDHAKVIELERRVAHRLGFEVIAELTGQTYSRLWDYRISARLGELAVALHKFSTDLRLLQSWGELEEPYDAKQVGSSAMPYKRNPMRAERLGSLSKYLLFQVPGIASMAATQWFERTLDDSALRRIALTQSFLAADAIVLIARNIMDGLIVHPGVVERRVREQLPFMAVEELLLSGVEAGGDRQDLHERIRQLTWQASERLKTQGGENPLREMLAADSQLGPLLAQQPAWEPARFTGRAREQTIDYLDRVVAAIPKPKDDRRVELTV